MFEAPTITAPITVEVKASADLLYEAMIDLDANKFVPTILSQEIVKAPKERHHDNNNGVSPKIGTVVREEKMFGGHKMVNYKTVTAVSVDPRSISAVIHKDLKIGSSNEPLRTGSWIIHPIDDQSCYIVWTFAASAAGTGISGWFAYCCCKKRILKRTVTHFQTELECYGAEAERRQLAQAAQVQSG